MPDDQYFCDRADRLQFNPGLTQPGSAATEGVTADYADSADRTEDQKEPRPDRRKFVEFP